MTKIDIISGFLGAGKTTFIKKLLEEAIAGEQVVLIENEFGQIGIDGGFLKNSGIEIREMNSGCICCSLVGDFGKSLEEVLTKYQPDRVIIEPSGVGKLSDVMKAVRDVASTLDVVLNSAVTIVDASKCKMYMKNFGEFFNNQIGAASCVILSRSQDVSEEKIAECLDIIRELNPHAPVVTTPWDQITGDMILEASNHKDALEKALIAAEKEHQESVHGHHHEHHHHHDHDHECECGHHHDHDHECEHHHDHDHECECGHHHDHEQHHHHDGESTLYFDEEDMHDADEVFNSIGIETAHPFTKEELDDKLKTLGTDESLGHILRSKGIVKGTDGKWFEFDFVSGDYEIRECTPDVGGRMCVIGEKLDAHKIYNLMKG